MQEEFVGVVGRVESLRGRIGESARHPAKGQRAEGEFCFLGSGY
jgi:hypothetical protein